MVALMLAFSGSDFDDAAYGYTPDAFEPPGTAGLDAHAAIGQQVTLTDSSAVGPAYNRMTTFLSLVDAGKVDLVVKGIRFGETRGWTYVGSGNFQIDQAGLSETSGELLGHASAVSPLTFTVVPLSSGNRIGIDRDSDGLLDHDERRDLYPGLSGHSNPFNPDFADVSGNNGSLIPDGIPDGQNDFDGDGTSNSAELINGTNPADNLADVPVFMTSIELSAAPGSEPTLEWTAVPGGVYQVQSSEDLESWIDEPTGQFIAPTTGGNMNWSDSNSSLGASDSIGLFESDKCYFNMVH